MDDGIIMDLRSCWKDLYGMGHLSWQGREHCGNTVVTERLADHCGNTAGTLREHCRNGEAVYTCGNTAGTLREHCRNGEAGNAFRNSLLSR